MSIFAPLYLKLSKTKYVKTFKPLGIKKQRKFLISTPHQTPYFLDCLGFLTSLRKLGKISLLIPDTLRNLCHFIKPKKFDMIFYDSSLSIMTPTHKTLKKNLNKVKFHYLIELRKPPNTALPYLTSIEKRICFFHKTVYPYYNILIKDGYKTLHQFFCLRKSNPRLLFSFKTREQNKILKKFGKKRPVLFLNSEKRPAWKGDTIIPGIDIEQSDPELYRLLFFANAYHGKCDHLYHFVRFFNKKVIEQ